MKTMKVLLAILTVAVTGALTAFGDDLYYGNWRYVLHTDGAAYAELVGYKSPGHQEEVTTPTSVYHSLNGVTYPVGRIGSIGSNIDCNKLTINGNNSIEVSNTAFMGCTMRRLVLKGVVAIEGAQNIYTTDGAFSGCPNLEEVEADENLKDIGISAFRGCTNLVAFTGATAVTNIHGEAFRNCTALESIVLPEALEMIGIEAFRGCASMRSVEIPDATTVIENYAFSGCTGLTNLTLGSGWRQIEANRFPNDAVGLDTLTVRGTGDVVIAENAFRGFQMRHVTLLGVSEVKGPYNYNPSNPAGAFGGCTNLVSVACDGLLTSVGNCAFCGCTSLTTFEGADGLKSIGDMAFAGCTALMTFDIPGRVETVGGNAFLNCTSLVRVSVPDSVTSLGFDVFAGCSSLAEVTLGCGLARIENNRFPTTIASGTTLTVVGSGSTVIADSAFMGCTMRRLVLKGVSEVEGPWTSARSEGAFRGCPNLEEVETDENLKVIGISAFRGCTNLVAFTGATAVTNVRDAAFQNCTALESIVLPEALEMIGIEAFRGCASMRSVEIPDATTVIENYAFSGCTGLTNLTLGSGWRQIEANRFPNDAVGLDTLTVRGTGDVVIAENAFRGFQMRHVTLLGVSEVKGPYNYNPSNPAGAFGGCTNLVSVACDGLLTSVGNCAFCGCTSLTTFEGADGLKSIGAMAFAGCESLTSITIPDSVTQIGEYVFWRSGVTSVCFNGDAPTVAPRLYYNASTDLVSYVKADSTGWKEAGSAELPELWPDNTSGGRPIKVEEVQSEIVSLGGYDYRLLRSSDQATSGRAEIIGETADYEGIRSPTAPAFIEYAGVGAYCSFSVSDLPSGMMGDSLGELVIEGDGTTVVGKTEYRNRNDLRRVTISGVRCISGAALISDWGAEGAFAGCANLLHVEFKGDSLEEIGMNCFSDCVNLRDLAIPDSVTNMANYAFQNCPAVTNIVIGSGLTVIFDKQILLNATNLQEVVINGNGDTIVASAAFRDSHIQNIRLSGVRGIGNEAFCRCAELVSVEFGECPQFEFVGIQAFASCPKLVSVAFPEATFTTIGSMAFYSCSALKSVLFGTGGYKFEGELTFTDCTALDSICLPEGLDNVGQAAFAHCSGLKIVGMPSSVTNIGLSAFKGCTNLQSLTLPQNLKSIGSEAFRLCESLAEVTIPSGVTDIGFLAFEYAGIETLTISEGVEDVGIAFTSLDKLKTLKIPSTMKTIAEGAFGGCVSLESVTIAEGVENIGAYAFGGCERLSSLLIPSSVESIGTDAFSEDEELKTVYVPLADDLERIKGLVEASGKDISKMRFFIIGVPLCTVVFDACGGTSDEMSREVMKDYGVGNLPAATREGWTFNGWFTEPQGGSLVTAETVVSTEVTYFAQWTDNVNFVWQYEMIGGQMTVTGTEPPVSGSVEIPIAFEGHPVTRIGDWAFWGNEGLTSVTIPEGVTAIGDFAFLDCVSLSSVLIPESVIFIGEGAFQGCLSLADEDGFVIIRNVLYAYAGESETVQIPMGVTNIYASAFSDHSEIKSLTIPCGVTEIGSEAFSYCSGLEEVSIPESVTVLPDCLFVNCTALKSVRIPSSVTIIGASVFGKCDGLKRVEMTCFVAPDCDENAFKDTWNATVYVPVGSTGWDGNPTSTALPTTWKGLPICNYELSVEYADWAAKHGLVGADAAWDAKPTLWGGAWANAFVYTFGEGLPYGETVLIRLTFDSDGNPIVTTAPVVSGHDEFAVEVVGSSDLKDWADSVPLVFLGAGAAGNEWMLPSGESACFFRVRLSK